MPVPWICRKCGKFAFNRSEMCIHLQEEYGVTFIEERTPKTTINAHKDNDNDLLVDEHVVYSDK